MELGSCARLYVAWLCFVFAVGVSLLLMTST
jgi:hypothetical protein